MKEKLYTIELHDALTSGDECPFCYLERDLEQKAIEFVLGSSYMESDTRDRTDRQGFCRRHTKMMYDYGNSLGNAWILKTRLRYLREGLKKQTAGFQPSAPSGLARLMGRTQEKTPVGSWVEQEESHCYICGRVEDTCRRVMDTFLYQVKHEKDFMDLVRGSKGFCIHHFGQLVDACARGLGQSEQEQVLPVLFEQMNRELERIQEDIDWLIEKYDYRNKDKDWRTSQDAVQRTMQKITGGYPADPVFRDRK